MAHHEICTALTVLRSNVALVRIHLRADPGAGLPALVHLDALDEAVDRLQTAAREMKRRHGDPPAASPPGVSVHVASTTQERVPSPP